MATRHSRKHSRKIYEEDSRDDADAIAIMRAAVTERVLNTPSFYPLGIIYTNGESNRLVLVHTIDEILPDVPFLLVMIKVEES